MTSYTGLDASGCGNASGSVFAAGRCVCCGCTLSPCISQRPPSPSHTHMYPFPSPVSAITGLGFTVSRHRLIHPISMHLSHHYAPLPGAPGSPSHHYAPLPGAPLRSPAWCTTALPCLVHHYASLPGAPLRSPAWCTTTLPCLVHHISTPLLHIISQHRAPPPLANTHTHAHQLTSPPHTHTHTPDLLLPVLPPCSFNYSPLGDPFLVSTSFTSTACGGTPPDASPSPLPPSPLPSPPGAPATPTSPLSPPLSPGQY